MSRHALVKGHTLTLAFLVIGALAAGPALADKPSWAGEKGGNARGKEHRKEAREEQRSGHFGDRQHLAVREYFGAEFKTGRCPPGLAKKRNGCLPPGQAKKWEIGRPLARDVVYYEVPKPLVVQLGQPPAGHKYVRVAGDILMIAVGTAIVVDAIQDLGR